jgi:hypothetical protein
MAGKSDKTCKPVAHDDPEQSKRFIETAREVEADESAEAFDKAFKKIAPRKEEGRQKDKSSPDFRGQKT